MTHNEIGSATRFYFFRVFTLTFPSLEKVMERYNKPIIIQEICVDS